MYVASECTRTGATAAWRQAEGRFPLLWYFPRLQQAVQACRTVVLA